MYWTYITINNLLTKKKGYHFEKKKFRFISFYLLITKNLIQYKSWIKTFGNQWLNFLTVNRTQIDCVITNKPWKEWFLRTSSFQYYVTINKTQWKIAYDTIYSYSMSSIHISCSINCGWTLVWLIHKRMQFFNII